jgi:hypothetical protein
MTVRQFRVVAGTPNSCSTKTFTSPAVPLTLDRGERATVYPDRRRDCGAEKFEAMAQLEV